MSAAILRRFSTVHIAYAIIVTAALTFDLLVDRAFGALLLSVLPISCIAFVCLLIGPWLEKEKRRIAWKNWAVGAVLILMNTLAFASLGSEQEKAGELIQAYALLILSFPFSFVLPIAEMGAAKLVADAGARMLFAWTVCVAAGCAQWWLLFSLRKLVMGASTDVTSAHQST